jgi:hypothetical protein
LLNDGEKPEPRRRRLRGHRARPSFRGGIGESQGFRRTRFFGLRPR